MTRRRDGCLRAPGHRRWGARVLACAAVLASMSAGCVTRTLFPARMSVVEAQGKGLPAPMASELGEHALAMVMLTRALRRECRAAARAEGRNLLGVHRRHIRAQQRSGHALDHTRLRFSIAFRSPPDGTYFCRRLEVADAASAEAAWRPRGDRGV